MPNRTVLFVAATLALSAPLAAVASACSRSSAADPAGAPAPAGSNVSVRTIDVTVHADRYEPAALEAVEGESLRLRFTRKGEGCVDQVVFPTLGLKKALPLDQAVTIDLVAPKAGEIPFSCAMDMVRGKLTVRAKK